MRYNLNGKNINIPDTDIKRTMSVLNITENEAIKAWLEDEGYIENAEQLELEEKAKKNKIKHGATSTQKKEKTSKPRTYVACDEKISLFQEVLQFLQSKHPNVTILKDNKLLQLQINNKTFKIDFIKQNEKKK